MTISTRPPSVRARLFSVLQGIVLMLVFINALRPAALFACACGCGVFDVGTSALFPSHVGGMVYVEYDTMNQNKNWSGTSKAPAENNDDKQLLSNFFTLGYEYMLNRSWGFGGTLPYTDRYFRTTNEDGDIVHTTHNAVGDLHIHGIYTGFSDDLSTGLTFGLKLPTGDFTNPNLDPDTEIGAGGTDLLLGAYHEGELGMHSPWKWFADAQMDAVILHYTGYKPGSEFDAEAGLYYQHWHIGKVLVAPLMQAVDSYRWRDSGTLADSPDTGYERLLIAPGIELDRGPYRLYADVGFPVYQNIYGNQIVASEYYKLNMSCHF